ncbi:MAG: CHAT domain-containing protein [Acidobacteria bacterium]|nr:CHAT domain-containing protein [Acidobacteriota bacterium]
MDSLRRDSALTAAGLRPGDVILSWERPPVPPGGSGAASGELGAPFDWQEAIVEVWPRAAVSLRGLRDGAELTWNVGLGRPDAKVHPRLAPPVEEELSAALALSRKGDLAGVARLIRLARLSSETGERELAAWLWLEAAAGDTLGKRYDAALDRVRDARQVLGAPLSSAALVALTLAEAAVWLDRKDYPRQAQVLGAGLDALQERGEAGLDTALLLRELGIANWQQGRLAETIAAFERSLALRERGAPGGFLYAEICSNYGLALWKRSDLDAAQQMIERGIAILETLPGVELDLARSLNNLGLIAWNRGDLPEAEAIFNRALRLKETLDPGGQSSAFTLNNLANVAKDRSDLGTAENYLRRALEIFERTGADPIALSGVVDNLGTILFLRQDFDGAQGFLERALEIRENATKDSLETANSLNNLGSLSFDRGELSKAGEYFQRVLEIRNRLAPESLHVASAELTLGRLVMVMGKLDEAERRFLHAKAIYERLAPRSHHMGEVLARLAELRERQGREEEALALLRQVLEIRRVSCPGGIWEAMACAELGKLNRALSRTAEALSFLRRSVDCLESQIGRLGGTEEARGEFRAAYEGYYHQLMDLLVERGDTEEAFRVYERSRARHLLSLLSQRELRFTADLPEDLDRKRRRVDREFAGALEAMTRLDPDKDREKFASLRVRLDTLEREREAVLARIRTVSPRLAALQEPRPLDAAGAVKALDEGRLLLAYSVGEDNTLVFSLSRRTGLHAYRVGLGREALSDRILDFRSRVRSAVEGAWSPEAAWAVATRLSEALLGPALGDIAANDRLLVVPDGPLHLLPFDALAVDARTARGPALGSGRKRAWLVEWKPLLYAASATVFAELRARQAGRVAGSPGLTAFGDPRYPVWGASDRPPVPALRGLRGAMAPLPWSGVEVSAVAGAWKGAAATYTGDAATERQARQAAPGTRLLHFACHGRADGRFPLNSALLLSIGKADGPAEEDGVLQAWEIMEGMRLDADLVTLSACDTGLGKAAGGEGMIGLTRAFQYAGARTVVASLWEVSDDATVELMRGFYRQLRRGRPVDDALREAQVRMIRKAPPRPGPDGTVPPDRRAPFFWAAFGAYGGR